MCSTHQLKSVNISPLTLPEFEDVFQNFSADLDWNCLFVLPFWLNSWWEIFGSGKELMILAVRSEKSLMGIAPLMIEGDTAMFMGSESLCDYQDMVLIQDCPDIFFTGLLQYLRNRRVNRLVLGALRPDSKTLDGVTGAVETLGVKIDRKIVDRFYELRLPKTWEGYLSLLDGKQRHEVRRKFRRIQEAGKINYHVIDSPDLLEDDILKKFFFLFESSRDDKAQFITKEMKAFFRAQARDLAKRDMLQLGFIYINRTAVATTFCFKYQKRLFLYNNGYHPEFASFSPGTIAKVLSIRQGIADQMSWYDFLKGDEAYKQHLGGKSVPLFRLTIDLKRH